MSVTPQAPPRQAERTPEDWRDLLLAELEERADEARLYEDYYNGEHPLQFATSKYREAFGALFGAFADNWCQIVVDAPVERLKVIGFRVGGGVDEDAWALWQANALDVESVIAHTEAGKCGRCFLLVDPNDGEPRITVEHPAQMIVAHDPGDRRRRLAALKRWLGDDGFQYLTLYLPDVVFKFESEKPVGAVEQAYDQTGIARIEWVPRTDVAAEVENPLGVVPVVPLENKPGLLGDAHSDLEPAVPLQNAVNKLCSDLIVTSEFGAFRQRVVTGVEVPKDPETGQPVASTELKATLSRLWTFKPADAKVWDLAATDLSNFVNAVEMFIQHLAAQTRTPPHYLLAKLVNASGDALSVAEAGLVSKCRTKTLFFSDSWEEAMALALTAAGTEVAQADCEAIWANPERVAQGQLVDAAVKKKTLGIPLPVIWLELGYTPEKIAEMAAAEQSAAEKALEDAAAAEAATPPAAPPPVTPPGPGPADQLPPGGTDG